MKNIKPTLLVLIAIMLLANSLIAYADSTSQAPHTKITVEQVQEIVQKQFPELNIVGIELDTDDKAQVFEVELIHNYMHYELEVDSNTGNIISTKAEDKELDTVAELNKIKKAKTKISLEQAQKIALENYNNAVIKSFELEKQGNKNYFKIEIFKDFVQHKLVIDASTGEIIKQTSKNYWE